MKYETVDALVEAHVADMVESATFGNATVCVNLAVTTLLAVLATAHAGDKEKLWEDFECIGRYVRRGIDNGEINFATYS